MKDGRTIALVDSSKFVLFLANVLIMWNTCRLHEISCSGWISWFYHPSEIDNVILFDCEYCVDCCKNLLHHMFTGLPEESRCVLVIKYIYDILYKTSHNLQQETTTKLRMWLEMYCTGNLAKHYTCCN